MVFLGPEVPSQSAFPPLFSFVLFFVLFLMFVLYMMSNVFVGDKGKYICFWKEFFAFCHLEKTNSSC